MEDFIIILIGFAVMLYSAYSKNKKAKEQKRKSQSDAEDSFEEYNSGNADQKGDIIEQFFGYDQDDKTQHPFQSEEELTKEDRTETSFSSYQNSEQLHISDKETTSKNTNKKERGKLQEEGIKALKQANYNKSARRKRNAQRKKAFNLRNAVIYSEILNRKY